jgi:hypothetical protein
LSTLPNDSIGSWGELESQFTRNFHSTYKRPTSLEEVKSCIQRKDKNLRSYIQRWSIIKNFVENVSDERAVDAFSTRLRRSDLVEELGRTRPRTVLELMEVANKFADGEDAYNNKRVRSPEVDRARRQRRRSRNEDSRTRRNQIAAGYERRDEEGYRSREFQDRNSREKAKVIWPVGRRHAPWTLSYPLCIFRWEKSLQSPNERLQNIPKATKRYGVKPRRTTWRHKHKSRIPSATSCKTFSIKSIHICNDPASPKVQKRAEEHIETSKLSNIITTSNYRILEVVRPARQVQQSRSPKESVQARTRANGIESANRGI